MAEESFTTKNQIKICYSDEEVLFYIAEFRKTYPDETSLAHVINDLYKMGNLRSCTSCESEDVQILKDGRLIKCQACFTERWLTSGTFFHGAKKLFPWMLDIYLKANGIFLASSRFHKLVGVAQSTALLISKKIATVIKATYEDEDPEISTSFFLELYFRRSAESIAQQHPRSEQAAVEAEGQTKSEDEHTTTSETNSAPSEDKESEMSDIQKEVFDNISTVPISGDELTEKLSHRSPGEVFAALTILEIAGLVERMSGDNYVRIKKASNPRTMRSDLMTDETESSFDMIKDFVTTLFHGVSRKHIEKYIAKFWCLIERKRWHGDELLHACAAFRQITDEEITASVTPPFMKMPVQCLQLSNYEFI